MLDDERAREIAAGMSKIKGEDYETSRFERQIYWYCRAKFALKALETAGYEIKQREVDGDAEGI